MIKKLILFIAIVLFISCDNESIDMNIDFERTTLDKTGIVSQKSTTPNYSSSVIESVCCAKIYELDYRALAKTDAGRYYSFAYGQPVVEITAEEYGDGTLDFCNLGGWTTGGNNCITSFDMLGIIFNYERQPTVTCFVRRIGNMHQYAKIIDWIEDGGESYGWINGDPISYEHLNTDSDVQARINSWLSVGFTQQPYCDSYFIVPPGTPGAGY